MEEKFEKSIKSDKLKKEIIELDKCVTADNPEMARNSNNDEPCDDGRS